jgi:D-serine deaminase-like pyridoxal phosphate-dependent protein
MVHLDYREVDTPAILIDLDLVDKNVTQMQKKASRYGVALRPHIKTHKIPELALLQIRMGAQGVTASKVSEAEVMAQSGIHDIFIANQIVAPKKLRRLADLSHHINVSVGLDSLEGARVLSEVFSAAGITIDYLIEINSGLDRCGVLPKDSALQLFREINSLSSIRFKGIYTHAGHAYGKGSLEEVSHVSQHESRVMVETTEVFKDLEVRPEIISVGSTPTMKVWKGYDGINEIRPGNYIFNDAIQVSLGVAKPEECALTVLATVISRPDPARAVIDAGSKVFALDQGAHGIDLVKGFGLVIGKNAILQRLSEEHGIISVGPHENLMVGETVRIIPNHACTVINLFDTAYGIREGKIEKEFRIAGRGKVQ